VALSVESRARSVSADVGETGGYSVLMRLMSPVKGPRSNGVPSCLCSVTRVRVREATVGGGKTFKGVCLEGLGDVGMSGVWGSKWQLLFEVWDVLDICL
jgi:hypothetical protein